MAHILSRDTVGFATGPAATGLANVAGMLRLWMSVWAERRALDRLDARMLRDIGLDQEEACREAGRPIWDVPAQRIPSGY